MDYYERLNLRRGASVAEINEAYKQLAKKYHPETYQGDKNIALQKMSEIFRAYKVLSDEKKRVAYDHDLKSDEIIKGAPPEPEYSVKKDNAYFAANTAPKNPPRNRFVGGSPKPPAKRRSRLNSNAKWKIVVGMLVCAVVIALTGGVVAYFINPPGENQNLPVYNVSFIAGEGGRIEGNVRQSVEEGKNSSEVTAVPDKGYVFVRWEKIGGGVYGRAAIVEQNVKKDVTWTAIFRKRDMD